MGYIGMQLQVSPYFLNQEIPITMNIHPGSITRFFTLAWIFVLLSSVAVFAQKGGFTGPGPALSMVKEVLTMRDDSKVTLRGNIVRHFGGDRYLFRDQTGSIQVDIDHDKWKGLRVGVADMVEISGEVDRDRKDVEVDVDRITKL